MNCVIEYNSLHLPIGTKFSIKQKSIVDKHLNLINGSKLNDFFAIFDENDVDFEIWCDNRECDRGIAMTLVINDKRKSFYIHPQKLCTFKALETNGRKLHFMSQNTDDGRYLVAQTAHKHGISYEIASINCSKIEFRVDVEQCLHQTMSMQTFEPKCEEIEPNYDSIEVSLIGTIIQLFVKVLTGRTITVAIGSNNTVNDLKMIIAKLEGIAPKQNRLIFDAKQLEDNKKLADYNIVKECTLQLVLRLRGGGCYEPPPALHELSDETATHVSLTANDKSHSHRTAKPNLSNRYTDVVDKSSSSSQLFSGERGVVCYGKQSDQQFKSYDGFIKDWNTQVNSFVIEMRMQSKYAPI